MKNEYSVQQGYDQEHVARYMKCLHEHNVRTGSFQRLDFTLTTFWGEAASKANYASPIRYILLENGNPVGLFQGLVQKKLFYKGLLAGSTSGNGITILPSLLPNVMKSFLLRILEKEKFSLLSIFTPTSLGILGFPEKRNYTLYIYLDKDINEISRNMKKKTRNRVRKARKSGVSVEFSVSTKALKQAYDVILSTSTLKSFSHFPRRYVEKLHECFQGTCSESVVALGYEQDETIISAAHLIGFDKKLILWQMGSTEKGYKLNAGSLMQARIIEWAKSEGYLLYDMGGTHPKSPVYAGIHRFKSGFGGSLVANTIIQKNAFYMPFIRQAYDIYKNLLNIS